MPLEDVSDMTKVYRNSLNARRKFAEKLVTNLDELEDFDIDEEKDINTNVVILNAYLKAMGVRLTFSDQYYTINSYDDNEILDYEDEETGETVTTRGYDRKAITSAIKSFVKDYNDTIDSGADAENTTILQKTLSMTQITNSNSKLLDKVGITIEKGNKLKVDEEKLNEADISTLKTLFNGAGSYAAQIGTRAGQISSAAVSASLNSSLYTSGASYNKNYYKNYQFHVQKHRNINFCHQIYLYTHATKM